MSKLTKTQWTAKYPGFIYPYDLCNGYLKRAVYDVSFDVATQTATYFLTLDWWEWGGTGAEPPYEYTTITQFVNGQIYTNEGKRMTDGTKFFWSNGIETASTPLSDTKGFKVGFVENPEMTYCEIRGIDNIKYPWNGKQGFLVPTPLKGRLAQGLSYSYLYQMDGWRDIHSEILGTHDGIFFSHTGTFFDISPTPTPPTPPTPPPAPTYKNYLFLDVELGDSTAGLTADNYCIPIIN